MNYSVIKSGGKQYVVHEGDELDIELLDQNDGKIELNTLLRVKDDKVEFGEPSLEKPVQAEIIKETKGDKKLGIKYKSGGYRRKFGHRQKYHRIKILEV